jgi:hypothetical protein
VRVICLPSGRVELKVPFKLGALCSISCEQPNMSADVVTAIINMAQGFIFEIAKQQYLHCFPADGIP